MSQVKDRTRVILEEWRMLKNERANLDALVEKYERYTLKGDTNLNADIYDNSALNFEINATLGFQAYLWDRSKSPTYTHKNKDLAEKDEIKEYYEQVSKIMAEKVFNNPETGFGDMFHGLIRDWRSLGTAFAIITETEEKPIMTFSADFKKCYFDTDDTGFVQSFYYEIEDRVFSAKDQNWEQVALLTKFWRESGRWSSITIDLRNQEFVEGSELEYNECPIFVARSNIRSAEKYGLGNGVMAVRDIEHINTVKKLIMLSVETNANPPMGYNAGLASNDYINLSAGGVNVFNNMYSYGGQSNAPVIPLMPMKEISEQVAFYQILISNLKDCYQFDKLLDLNPTSGVSMTASEVMARNSERATLFSGDATKIYASTMDAMQKSFLSKAFRRGWLGVTERTLEMSGISAEDLNGALVVPAELDTVEKFLDVTVSYHSAATEADYSTKLQNISQTFQFIAGVEAQVAQLPSLAEAIDLPAMKESFAKYSGASDLIKTLGADGEAMQMLQRTLMGGALTGGQ